MIHMSLPMLLLAAIGLEPVIMTPFQLVKGWLEYAKATNIFVSCGVSTAIPVLQPQRRVRSFAGIAAIVGGMLALLLLVTTLQNMFQVTYVHSADGPHEMMIYVQTTPDVNTVLAKIDALDQKLSGGNHQLSIGLTDNATWPYAWYLRDYIHVCFQYPKGCMATAKDYPVIITGGDTADWFQTQYGSRYAFHRYKMRAWWDEGYKPPPVPCTTGNCPPTWGGVGPWLWLSYGDNPPPGATFNLEKAVSNVWQWWWDRKAIGSTGGEYDMELFILKGHGVAP
jgi:predicted membrane-bound mannosyltransferase